MKNFINLSFSLAVTFALTDLTPAMAANFNYDKIIKQDSTSNDRFLKQLYLSSNQALLSAKLTADHSNNSSLKGIGGEIVDNHIAMNDAIRTLAKKHKVNLPMSMPAGGQRPDGRIDSAPENLQDTTRTQNAVGEAAVPSGKVKEFGVINEVAVNQKVAKLKGLNASAFNTAYREEAIANQQLIITMLEDANASKNSEIKRFSKKYLSTSKQLLKKLEQMKSE